MFERLTKITITFANAFTLDGVDGTFPAGSYAVETTEEQIDGLTFVAYRRVATTITLPVARAAHLSWQHIEIDPAALAASIACDAEQTLMLTTAGVAAV